MNKIEISFLDDGNILVKDLEKNEDIIIDSDKKKKLFFKEISRYKIKKKMYDNDQECLYLQSDFGKICIHDYLELRQEDYFDDVTSAIVKYNKKNASKAKLIKNTIVGSIVAGSLTAGVIAACSINNNNSYDAKSISDSSFVENNIDKEITIDLSDDIIYDEEVFIEEDKLDNNIYYDYKNDIPYISEEEDVDPLSIDVDYEHASDINNDVSPEVKIEKEKETKIDNIIENNNTVDNNNIIDIKPSSNNNSSSINDFTSYLDDYEDVIRFASDVYNIDYDTAKSVACTYQECITGKKGTVSLYMPYNNAKQMIKSDVDRIKDLSEKGYIKPDI